MWGETVEPQELLLLGERIWNGERLFNLAAGFTRADDTLPPRLLHEPVPEGPSAGQVVDLPPMLDEYYISRGWDEGGVPSAAKLARLGLTRGSGGRTRGRPPRELGRPRAVPGASAGTSSSPASSARTAAT